MSKDMEVVLDIAKGDKFKCFEEAKQKITESAQRKFVQFYKRESRTISGGAKKTKRYLNPDLKFYQVEWACVHGGRNYKCRSNGFRSSKTLRHEYPCPAHIRMKVSPEGEDFVIANVNNNHNHIVSESLFNMLPHRRKLPPEIKKETKSLLNMHVNRHSIKEEIEQKYNKQITMKDLANIHNEDKFRKRNLNQQTKYNLLSTKLKKAASLGAEAYGDNFDKVSSLFDDIIKMLQNKTYEFEFSYAVSDIAEDDLIEYNIPNDDTSDNTYVCSNINVASIETVPFEQDDNDTIMANNCTDFCTADTVFDNSINENDHVDTETFDCTENNTIECSNTVYDNNINISENCHMKTETDNNRIITINNRRVVQVLK
ncbi:unnamed protein product [Ceutorhynchus assimilis]|uniref:ZSWIM3 N-terminal domain-containing protein n=1 Tax=Ceutorhynchus assimilis TaxID=467358 RepID=A0A9N9MXP9_9CUCU|nr:unnamed protein product [Ceutorhynchus assimilis]